MLVILLLAALAILGCVVLASLGRAGEMAMFPADYAPLGLDAVSAADVALLRPPMSLWGYQVQATEEALQLIARSVRARDTELAELRQQLARLRNPVDAADEDDRAWPAHGDPGHDLVWPEPGDPGNDLIWPAPGDLGSDLVWRAPGDPGNDPVWPAPGDLGNDRNWPIAGDDPPGDD